MREEGLINLRKKHERELWKDFGGREKGDEFFKKVKEIVKIKRSCVVDWKLYAQFYNSVVEENESSIKEFHKFNDLLKMNFILTIYEGFEIKDVSMVDEYKQKLRFSKRTEASKLAKALKIPLTNVEYMY